MRKIVVPQTTGFTRADIKTKHRLICSVDALEKCGKTHFSLSAPRPLGFIDLDRGLEGVANKFDLSNVYISDLGEQFARASTMAVEGQDAQQVAKAADKVWAQFRHDFTWGLENLRSLVVDTGTEMHELIRLARFGKLTQVMPEMYGPVYGELSALIKQAYSSDCNLILLHRLKQEYEQSEASSTTGRRKPGRPTGRLIRAGYKDMGYLVQLSLRLGKFNGSFTCTIEHCRHNPALEGQELPEPIIGFPALAGIVFPDSTPAHWA